MFPDAATARACADARTAAGAQGIAYNERHPRLVREDLERLTAEIAAS